MTVRILSKMIGHSHERERLLSLRTDESISLKNHDLPIQYRSKWPNYGFTITQAWFRQGIIYL